MFVNFRSFPPDSGMVVMAVLSDRSIHYSPCLSDHKTARGVFAMVLSNGGIVEASWIDPTRGEPVEIATYSQCGITTPGGLLSEYERAVERRDARRAAPLGFHAKGDAELTRIATHGNRASRAAAVAELARREDERDAAIIRAGRDSFDALADEQRREAP